MTDVGTHKKNLRHGVSGERLPRNHDRAAAWLVLIFAGATQVSFNIWHAIHGGMPMWLAVLYGLAPVALAMGMSHVVAAYRGGWFMKIVTFGVMLGAMVLSIRATGVVVKPATGAIWWLFGATVDTAALVALQVILSPESRAAAKAARKATREAATEATVEAVPSATAEAIPDAVREAISEAVSEAAMSAAEMPAGVPPAGPAEEPSTRPSVKPVQAIRQRPARISEEPNAKKARSDYRKSVQQGQPLSDRELARKYDRSRTWGASRIREVEAGPQPLAGSARAL